MGGVYLGEIAHRLSYHLRQNHHRRPNPHLRNTVASIINPIGMFYAWINKDIAKLQKQPAKESFLIKINGGVGINFPRTNTDFQLLRQFLHVDMEVEYGELYKNSKGYRPFDYFHLATWLDISYDKPQEYFYLNIESHAPLSKKRITSQLLSSLTSHYHYLHNQVFKLSSMSLTTDLTYVTKSRNNNFLTSLRPGLLLFGGANSDIMAYLPDVSEALYREYVYGRGFTTEVAFDADLGTWGAIDINYNRWWLYTKRDAKGLEDNAIFKMRYTLPIYKAYGIYTEVFHYFREGRYPDVADYQSISRKYIEYKLGTQVRF